MITEYFYENMFTPFFTYLRNNRDMKIKLKHILRIKLLIFLIKTKVIIKLINNCKIVRSNDIFVLNKQSFKWQQLSQSLTYVYLSSEADCLKEYNKLGKHLQSVFMALLNSNNINVTPDECLELLNNPNYFDEVISNDQIEKITKESSIYQQSSIIKPTTAFSYVGSIFNKNLKEECELHFCFPNPEFIFQYYKLIDSKWTKFGMNVLSTTSSVAVFKKFYIPSNIFEKEFKTNDLYPETQVRLLRHNSFDQNIPPDFFVQKFFIDKATYKKYTNSKVADVFWQKLSNYELFDYKKEKSKLNNFRNL